MNNSDKLQEEIKKTQEDIQLEHAWIFDLNQEIEWRQRTIALLEKKLAAQRAKLDEIQPKSIADGE